MWKTATQTKLYAIHLGGISPYEAFTSPYEAGYLFGDLLYKLFSDHFKVKDEEEVLEIVLSNLERVELGLHVEPFFTGHNYVSLFAYEPLTNEECEDVLPEELYRLTGDGYEEPEELSDQEWQEFLSGLKDGILFG